MLRKLIVCLGLILAAPAPAQDLGTPPAGRYTLDLGHARLLFRVNHLGFSRYTALFTRFDATLDFDPARPEAMVLTATIDAGSVETHYPDPALDFNATLTGPEFLDVATFPEATLASTAVALTGAATADVTANLTLHGVTRPIVLKITYNGGWGHHPMDPAGARIGFSAETAFNRSDFGMGYGVPAPGTTMGVSDRVDVIIEAEFTNADAPRPEPAQP